jgi:hypothetical protein
MKDFSELARAAAALATGQLGWRPDEFWAATMAELRLAIEGRFGPPVAPLARVELERLREGLADG